MTCPTCDHTMQKIDRDDCPRMFWCPRCGTLKCGHHVLAGIKEVHTPKLVERCRGFSVALLKDPDGARLWFRLGIEEAIHVIAERRYH